MVLRYKSLRFFTSGIDKEDVYKRQALDSSGDIYIADTGNDIIRKDTIK